MNIDEIYKIVEESSHETAYSREHAEGLYNYLMKLKDRSVVVEIGIEYGRSTSVIAEVSKEKKFYFTAIDNWASGKDAQDHVARQREKYGWDFDLISGDSKSIVRFFKSKIDLLHIDGDHTYHGVASDCDLWIPKVKKGGIIMFHDYGHEGIEGVKLAVDEYITFKRKLKLVDIYGKTLAVFRK